jgi:hypothetical protein
MNFLRRLLKPSPPAFQPEIAHKSESMIKLEEETEKLWKDIKETLEFYDSVGCPCAFPRFHQYAAIDCVEFRASFYMSETEAILHHCGPYFDVKETDKGDEAYRALYTCKKCQSTYDYAWSDFSIRISRTYLKVKDLKAIQVGPAANQPTPFYIGLFGPKLPDPVHFKRVELEDFIAYLRNIG